MTKHPTQPLITDEQERLSILFAAPHPGTAHDPEEVYQVRVQIDQSIYVRGTIEEIARTAFQAGYERGKEETCA